MFLTAHSVRYNYIEKGISIKNQIGYFVLYRTINFIESFHIGRSWLFVLLVISGQWLVVGGRWSGTCYFKNSRRYMN